MPRNRNQQQFDEYREWQWCKHLALSDYIVPWSMRVGSTAKNIFIADLFAGAASYRHPDTGAHIADGSPPIFARRAKKYSEERPGHSLHVICVERDRENYALLEKRLAGFKPYVTTLPGDFALHVPHIIETLGDAPALILLDPIGLQAIDAEAWRPLLERPGKTDLFITLHFKAVHRAGGMLLPTGHADPAIETAPELARTFDRVFSSFRWRPVAVSDLDAATKERRYLDIYFEDVIGERHRYKCAYPVRSSAKAAVKYWLVYASDDFRAVMLMNDEIVKLDELLYARTFDDHDSITDFMEHEIDARRLTVQEELKGAVLACLSTALGRSLTFTALRDLLLPKFFGRVKQGAYAKAVKVLVKEERVGREDRAAAKISEDEVISLLGHVGSHASAHRTNVIPFRRSA